MAISWPTILAMTLFPAITGRGKASHLQLVASNPASALPAMANEKPAIATDVNTKFTAAEPLPTRELAVAELMRFCVEEWGGGSLQFRHVMAAYGELIATRKAPPMSKKALSQQIKRHGCKSHTGPRLKDGSRPTIVTFPIKQRRRLSA